MNKHWIYYLTLTLALYNFIIACAGNNNSGNQATPVAATPPVNSGFNNGFNNCGMGYGCNNMPYGIASVPPMNMGCLYGTMNCQMDMYNQYGFTPYQINPYQWGGYFSFYYQQYGFIQSGNMNFCNCPIGTRPVYNGMAGLGCVQIDMINPYMNTMIYYGLSAQNYQFVNTPQYSNMNGSANGCYSNLGQACFINQSQTCGPGAFCQVTAPASNIGVCVSNGSTNGNGPLVPR